MSIVLEDERKKVRRRVKILKKCRMNVGIASSDWSYYPGQEVLLDDDLSATWNENGHCTILEDIPEPEVPNVPEQVLQEIVSLGGGWYQVPDGNRFRGKAAAEEYLMNGGALNAGDNAPEQINTADNGTPVAGDSEATPQN